MQEIIIQSGYRRMEINSNFDNNEFDSRKIYIAYDESCNCKIRQLVCYDAEFRFIPTESTMNYAHNKFKSAFMAIQNAIAYNRKIFVFDDTLDYAKWVLTISKENNTCTK